MKKILLAAVIMMGSFIYAKAQVVINVSAVIAPKRIPVVVAQPVPVAIPMQVVPAPRYYPQPAKVVVVNNYYKQPNKVYYNTPCNTYYTQPCVKPGRGHDKRMDNRYGGYVCNDNRGYRR